MTKQILRCIEAKKPLAVINQLVTAEYLRLDRAEWDKVMREEYDLLFPEYYPTETEVVFTDGIDVWKEAKIADGFEIVSIDEETPIAHYKKAIDYSQDENYLSLSDWLAETKQVLVGTETATDDYGVEYEKEIFEEVPLRVYVASDVTDLVATNKEILEYKAKLVKNSISDSLSKLTVTTSSGNTFDSNLEARQNMADGILASQTMGLTETIWRLADNTEKLIDINELREAHAMSLQAYATTKAIGVK